MLVMLATHRARAPDLDDAYIRHLPAFCNTRIHTVMPEAAADTEVRDWPTEGGGIVREHGCTIAIGLLIILVAIILAGATTGRRPPAKSERPGP
jgi:hypothetical protein